MKKKATKCDLCGHETDTCVKIYHFDTEQDICYDVVTVDQNAGKDNTGHITKLRVVTDKEKKYTKKR